MPKTIPGLSWEEREPRSAREPHEEIDASIRPLGGLDENGKAEGLPLGN